MTAKELQDVIDAIFKVIDDKITNRPVLLVASQALQAVVDANIPLILAILNVAH